MSELSLFDFLPDDEAARFKPIKSDDWKWSFADYPKEKNGLKVFSCFACGGGSTMGYKLAGCDVIGCCEIDPRMNEVYVKNHNPKYNFLMDIRDFNKIPDKDLPEELFNLDVLDGSPPCTTFSMAGQREDSWGKKKKFREGQTEQTLDDLSFVFIETVKKLMPKVVVMENVEGLILGEAFKYVRQIYSDFNDAGYLVNHWLVKGEKMGVPQKRHRVIFVACRKDTGIDPSDLDMMFNYYPILFKEIRSEKGTQPPKSKVYVSLLEHMLPTDKYMGYITLRVRGVKSGYNTAIVQDDDVCQTLIAGGGAFYRGCDKLHMTDWDTGRAATFPTDYDYCGQPARYVCGMSVPPIMMKRVITRLIDEGVFRYKIK